MTYQEINFDGIPGPTHLFAGLSQGNIASTSNEGVSSSPKQAALQSIKKIKFCHDLGLTEAIVPPQRRPDLSSLNTIKKSSDKLRILSDIYHYDEKLFKTLFSSSNMWTANAATVSPSVDSGDNKLHLTVANLITNPHRALEAKSTYKYFTQVFKGGSSRIHIALDETLYDEGAANHIRFAPEHGKQGIQLFCYGFSNKENLVLPQNFPARQSREAQERIIRLHDLRFENIVLAQQNPKAIDQGVFHNDVISTGNLNFYLYHEKTFANSPKIIEELTNKYKNLCGEDLILQEVKDSEVSIKDAVESYIFNSQIISLGKDQGMLILAPQESQNNQKTNTLIDKILKNKNNPISKVEFYDLKESMQNGGGPACLRLRVVCSQEEYSSMKKTVFFNDELHQKLESLINNYYPDELKLEDLCKAEYLKEIDECFNQYEQLFDLKL